VTAAHRAPGTQEQPAPASTPASPAPAAAPLTAPVAPTGTDNRPAEDRRDDPSTGPQAPAGIASATPAAPAAPVTEVAAPEPARPATPATPASQVAMHIVPLRRDADGVHRLTVHLHPVDLGPVSVVAEIRNGNVSVQLSGGTESGRQALHAALPQLHQELIDAGFTNCSLDLRQDAPGSGPEYRQPTPAQPGAAGAAAQVGAPAESEAGPSVDRNRLLDLRV
jgi:flagellar hook-length control protein FliK